MDKWVPGICIVLSAVFACTAYFLWSTNVSIASDTIIQKHSKEDLVFESNTFEKKRILIVPGHDTDNHGAKFNDLKEEELNLELAKKLFNFLSKEDSFEVFITRDRNGYVDIFEKYFNQEDEINNFIYQNKAETKKEINSGLFEPVNVVEHNHVGEEVATKLYGINKWSNENNIDLILHIHFNDYPRKNINESGKYNGFSIYIPSQKMNGYFDSKKLSQSIRNNLRKIFKESNLPVEKDIIIENSDLIAVGSNNTLDNSIPILVEYGYIYEPHFYDKEKRNTSLDNAAYQTYFSIKDFFLE